MNKISTANLEIKTMKNKVGDLNIYTVFTTTIGLKKKINEDTAGVITSNNKLRACITDGHWGFGASEYINKFFINDKKKFPKNKKQAIRELKKIEAGIFNKYGNIALNGINDITTEAGLIALEIDENNISIISYGDCRGFIIKGESKIEIKKIDSWLGGFSYMGLRNRLPVEEGILFKKIEAERKQTIVLFSDGIDECIYETPTIPIDKICKLCSQDCPGKSKIMNIMDKVFSYGAEDNASIIIIEID